MTSSAEEKRGHGRRALVTAMLAIGLGAAVAAPTIAEAEGTPPSPPATQAGKQATPRAAAPSDRTATPPVDPEAIAALERMGAYLRALDEFSVRARTTKDEVLENDQQVQLSGTTVLWARRPNKLRVDVTSDRKERQLFYDGKTFTLYGPKNRYYASFAAPPTVRELIEVAEERYGIDFPLDDLFYWGTDKSGLADIRSAVDVGPAKIEGLDTEQYAFRQKDVDWQIWIERGERPLPRKLVITTTDDPARPQFSTVLGWNLSPRLDDKDFQFIPPEGAHRIVFDADARPATPKK